MNKLRTIGDINHSSRFDPNLAERLNKLAESPSVSGTNSEGRKNNSGVVSQTFTFAVDDLVLRGNDDFYCDEKNVGQQYKGIPENAYVGVPVSLENCLKWAGDNNGVVATIPFLVAGLSVAQADNYLRQRWHTAYSEEFSGIDTEGVYKKGKPVVIVQHGIELLLPDRIRKAYNDGLTSQNGAKLTPDEWKKVLQAKNPLYTVQDVREGKVKNPFGCYRVVLGFDEAKATSSGYQDKDTFVNNDLVIARAGTLEYIEPYFDNIQSGDTVCNGHRFGEIDPKISQGRVLFVNGSYYGLHGVNLDGDARFVVAPEAQGNSSRK